LPLAGVAVNQQGEHEDEAAQAIEADAVVTVIVPADPPAPGAVREDVLTVKGF
jgi:hypothetical protein